MDRLKVGVIGGGYWGKKHIFEYSQLQNAKLSWICDLDSELLKSYKKEYPKTNTTTDYKEVLESDVDALSICVNNENHFKLSTYADTIVFLGKNKGEALKTSPFPKPPTASVDSLCTRITATLHIWPV